VVKFVFNLANYVLCITFDGKIGKKNQISQFFICLSKRENELLGVWNVWAVWGNMPLLVTGVALDWSLPFRWIVGRDCRCLARCDGTGGSWHCWAKRLWNCEAWKTLRLHRCHIEWLGVARKLVG